MLPSCDCSILLILFFSFIKQYYEMLTKNPSNLYRFYKDESCMVHAESNDAMELCTGLERIKARIAELSLPEGVTVDLKEGSVDAQKSENDSVFLMVTGRFIHPNLDPRPFVQSFVLASQVNPASQSSGPSYYVRNSVFRAIAPEVQTRVIERVVEVPVEIPVPAPVQTPTQPAEPEPLKEEAPEIDESAWSQPSSAIVEQLETEPEREVQSEDHGPPAPKSFADMVRSWGQSAPSSNSDRVQYNLDKPSSVKPAAVAADERKENVPIAAHQQPSRAIFVNHVDATHKQADIESFFAKFGQVVNVDLPPGRGYAFVDFAEHESIQAVLAAHAKEPLTLSGKALLIEERQAKGRGAGKPRGDRAEGRDRPERKQHDRKMGDRKMGEREGRGKPAGDRKPTDKASRRPGPPADDKSPKN